MIFIGILDGFVVGSCSYFAAPSFDGEILVRFSFAAGDRSSMAVPLSSKVLSS